MSGILLFLLILAVAIVVATILVDKKRKLPKRIMREGKLVKSDIVYRDGEKLYVEKIAFKDWHVCIHYYYLISGENICIDGGMTRQMIYHGDHGWKLTY